jgi:transcriptional regulator with XRE-family HTH domain
MTKKNERSLLATNIVNLRKAQGWSQDDLAHRVGVHLNTIKTIETDKSEGTFETRMAIAGALKCELSDLYRDKAPAPKPRGLVRIPETIEFLSKFSKLSPARRDLVLAVAFDDESIIDGVDANDWPQWLSQRLLVRSK